METGVYASVSGRKLKHVSFIAVIVAAVVLCGCTGDEEKIKKTVIGFFESVSSGDLDALQRYFPEFEKLDKAGKDAYITGFAGFSQWDVRSIAIDGSGAVAAVEVVFGGAKLIIQLPLAYEDRRWIVTERTSMRAKIDVVPAE